MPNITYEAEYRFTDIVDSNNNKFWRVEVYDDNTYKTIWGRIGCDNPQSKVFYDGRHGADKRANEKTRKGYILATSTDGDQPIRVGSVSSKPQNMDLKKVARQIKTNSPEADKLIDYLIERNVHHITETTSMKYNASTGLFSTDAGPVTENGVSRARTLLVDLANYVQQNEYSNKGFAKALNEYFMYIPQNFGMSKPDVRALFPDIQSVQVQNNILDGIEASLQLSKSQNQDSSEEEDKPEQVVFDAKINLVTDDAIINYISKKYLSTLQKYHSCSHLTVNKVYEIEITDLKNSFHRIKDTIGNVQELWHGTSGSNLLSILKSGLKISPPSTAYIAGKLLGNGIYFANSSTKSLNYSYGHWSGKTDNNCFMFLADVALGKQYVPSSLSGPFPKPGHDSTWGKAHHTGSLINDEFVVYQEDRFDLKYLVEFK